MLGRNTFLACFDVQGSQWSQCFDVHVQGLVGVFYLFC
jgi:hypothetical protein